LASSGNLGLIASDKGTPSFPNNPQMTVTSAGVGIGTSSPGARLHVDEVPTVGVGVDALKITSGGGIDVVSLLLQNTGAGGLRMRHGVGTGMAYLASSGNLGLIASDKGTPSFPNNPQMTVTSAGVGVVGDITVTGDVLLTGADCAEQFDFSGMRPDPGTVLVIDDDGGLQESYQPYDKKVAGVVSGGGEYKHSILLDSRGLGEGRVPLALVGKVYCKVDASYSPVRVGDLLTTSATAGYAMRATDPLRSHGSVFGKALKELQDGQGIIPILVALQ
jgi:hypothetical protein